MESDVEVTVHLKLVLPQYHPPARARVSWKKNCVRTGLEIYKESMEFQSKNVTQKTKSHSIRMMIATVAQDQTETVPSGQSQNHLGHMGNQRRTT